MTADQRMKCPPTAEDPVVADLLEEFTARLQAGEAIDWEVCAAEHPALAERLRALLPALELLAAAGSSASNGSAGRVPLPRPLPGVEEERRGIRVRRARRLPHRTRGRPWWDGRRL